MPKKSWQLLSVCVLQPPTFIISIKREFHALMWRNLLITTNRAERNHWEKPLNLSLFAKQRVTKIFHRALLSFTNGYVARGFRNTSPLSHSTFCFFCAFLVVVVLLFVFFLILLVGLKWAITSSCKFYLTLWSRDMPLEPRDMVKESIQLWYRWQS